MNAETKRCFAALLRKQRREQSAFLNRSARTGKQRTQTGKLAFGALYGAIALVLMASFASLSWPLAQLLLPGGWEDEIYRSLGRGALESSFAQKRIDESTYQKIADLLIANKGAENEQ